MLAAHWTLTQSLHQNSTPWVTHCTSGTAMSRSPLLLPLVNNIASPVTFGESTGNILRNEMAEQTTKRR